MSSDFEHVLRQLKPEKRHHGLKPRDENQLPFIGISPGRIETLLYDTTVYVDILEGRFPLGNEAVLRAATAWHSAVTEAELATACTSIDPTDPRSRDVVKRITRLFDLRPAHRTIAPDREVWQRAGALAGVIARLQRLSKPDRRSILNDALIFSTGRKFGHTVLTRNIRDFDFLNQLDPLGRILFYRI